MKEKITIDISKCNYDEKNQITQSLLLLYDEDKVIIKKDGYTRPDCPKCRTNKHVNSGTGIGGSGTDENGNYSIQNTSDYSCSKCNGKFSITIDYVKVSKKNAKKIYKAKQEKIKSGITGSS